MPDIMDRFHLTDSTDPHFWIFYDNDHNKYCSIPRLWADTEGRALLIVKRIEEAYNLGVEQGRDDLARDLRELLDV